MKEITQNEAQATADPSGRERGQRLSQFVEEKARKFTRRCRLLREGVDCICERSIPGTMEEVTRRHPKPTQVGNDAVRSTPLRHPGGQVRSFLDRAYWVVGTFCFAWSLSVVIGILRRRTLDLPVLGETEITETIIFTLLGFSLLLPILLYIVATWRSTAALRGWRARFPGAPGDKWEIPASFAWLRGLLFLVLVGGSVATMQLCYQRMLGLEIHWQGDGEKIVLRQSNPPGRTLFSFPPLPAAGNQYSNWRWIGRDSDGAKTPSKVTAAPGYMPWAFRFISYGSIAVTAWFLITPPGFLRRRILKRAKT